MLDIETLSTRDYAIIISLGIVYFNPNTRGTIMERFYVTIDPEEAEKIGQRLSAATVVWWMTPDKRDAWEAWTKIAHFSPALACQGLQEWFAVVDTVYDSATETARLAALATPEQPDPRIDERIVWGNGPEFDNKLVRQMYELVGVAPPFTFRGDRDFRTMKSLPNAKDCCPPDQGTAHNAIDDATYQALWLQNINIRHNLVF